MLIRSAQTSERPASPRAARIRKSISVVPPAAALCRLSLPIQNELVGTVGKRSLGIENCYDRTEVIIRSEVLETLCEFLKFPGILVTPSKVNEGTSTCLPNRVDLFV